MNDIQNDKKSGEKRFRAAWSAVRSFVIPFIKGKYRCDIEAVPARPPYLLISNHAMNMDPILIGMASPGSPLAFVASEHLERQGAVTKLLNAAFEIIPRSKASAGSGAVRNILRVLRRGKSVALFAEGDCTWDGVSQPVFPATAKLAKAARVPLVIYRLNGNYLSKPRWAKRPRFGRITGEVVRVISPAELDEMSAEEVDRAINSGIFVDIWEEQRRFPVEYKCASPAEGLERALFICPECGNIGSMLTRGRAIVCGACGARSEMDEKGFLHGGKFGCVREWDSWQYEELKKLIRSDGRMDPLFEGRGTLRDLHSGKAKKIRFRLDLARAAMELGDETLPFSSISDAAMVKTDRLLFTADDKYRELHSKRGILRPYLMAIKAFNEQNGEGRLPRPGKEG